MSSTFDFKTVPNIRFATGCSDELAQSVTRLGISKLFVVTDSGVLALKLLDSALASLDSIGLPYEIYSDVVADPPQSTVLSAVDVAKREACDGVVGFGGGSSMDVAKLVAVLINGGQELEAMYGVDQIAVERVPLIQVPTTAGTGSEATAVAIVTTGETTKAGVVSEKLFADSILLDPTLTLGLPAHVTAATGIDAMVHAIEAYTSTRLKNPMSDMLALKALGLMASSIRTAVNNGNDLGARGDMLLGAMLAGQAFANAPVGAVHALAYPLGGIYHIPHGLSNSLVLPHVLRFNAANAESLYAELLSVILPQARAGQAAEQLADYFTNLAKDLGLQTNLREMGIEEAELAELAKQSMLQQRLLINNPRVVTYDDALEIYRQAY